MDINRAINIAKGCVMSSFIDNETKQAVIGVLSQVDISNEVANINNNWEISSQAMASLINLVVDCCKRNKISKLVWSELKADRINHKNGCNMTVHRDFAFTTCPGDYLYFKMPYIASEVNKQLIPFSEEGVGAFVERLYQTTLGRPSDSVGKAHWIEKARCCTTGADLAYGFLRSPEFLRLSSDMADEKYVETLYQAFFGRRSDPIGLDYWCGRLEAGYDRDSIIEGFIGSVEWHDLCRSYGKETTSEPCDWCCGRKRGERN